MINGFSVTCDRGTAFVRSIEDALIEVQDNLTFRNHRWSKISATHIDNTFPRDVHSVFRLDENQIVRTGATIAELKSLVVAP